MNADPRPLLQPGFVPPDDLEDELPPWQRTLAVPVFQPPREPRPVGFVRGRVPLLLVDVSGTLAPRLRGLFAQEVAAAMQLLAPRGGEFATQAAFDVITFATGAHSWSMDFMRKARIIREGKTMLAGRQVCPGGHMDTASFLCTATSSAGNLAVRFS